MGLLSLNCSPLCLVKAGGGGYCKYHCQNNGYTAE